MFPSHTPSRWITRPALALQELEDRTNPAPPLLQTIPGITFDENAANNGGAQFIPPDPNGAAGPAHVVSIVNASIEFHRISDGAQQLSQSLGNFFASLSPATAPFDPKVVYDQFENRFVVVALEQSGSPQTSRILLAVSDDSDPNGTWRFASINSRLTISGNNTWADYPGFAVDEEAVYVTANMFTFANAPAGVRLWVVAKGTAGGWYAGGTATVSTALNPYESAGFAITTMPAHIYGTAPAGGTGTFLVGYDGLSGGGVEAVQVTRIDNPLGTPSFTVQQVSVGDIDNTSAGIPGAPQSGTATTVDAGDRRVYNAVWRNNHLYFGTTVNPGSGADAGQATAHWFNVNTTSLASLTLTDQGNVSGNDIAANAYTFFPNVAVDAAGDLGIGFAASAASIFPGAYYTARKSTDAAGTVQSTGTLQAGVASYVRTFGGAENRWGDFSGLQLAPDGFTFWAFNEYAMTQGSPSGGENGRWATTWGRFAFNTPPRVTAPIPDVTVNEDAAPTNIDLNPFFEDTEDPDSALVYTVVANTNPGLVSTSFPAGNTLRLTYAANGSGTADITVRATDTGGGTVDSRFLVTVNPVNDAPVLDNTGTMALADIAEDPVTNSGTLVFDIIASAGGDRITDADSGALEGLAITAADTANGAWEFSTNGGSTWSALGAVSATNARLLAADSNTRVRFVPAADFNGALATALTFRAWDRTSGTNGGTADPSTNGGATAFSTATETASLTVISVNDAPSFAKGPNQTVNEDAGAQSVANWATVISAGPANESGQTLTFVVTTSNDGLFSALPAVNPGTGTLTYTPAANAFGSATVTVKLQDNGGTANNGVDTSAPQTFTITVNSVNDAPTFTPGGNQTVNEDAGAQSVTNWAANVSPGPANESGQTLTFEVSTNNDALFAVLPAISAATGALTYTPAADAHGSATVTVRLRDNGGTANGGTNVSPDQTFTITVNSVNDAPSFTRGANQVVNEDAGAQSVPTWATAISKGPANEGAQGLTFDVTTNNDALFSALPAVSPATGTLTYTPAADAFGVATVTVRLRDDGGTANGGVDTSAAQTFTITVNSVNDAPSFAKGPDQTVNEDAGPQSVAEWATAISKGPANESGQTLTFEVTANTNAALFSAAPAVSPAGTLTYTPVANASGSATVTLRLHDDGGTANGGVDVGATQTFTITVNSVNDAPSFAKGADQTANEDAGAQSATGWATGISAGPANESGQVLTFNVATNNDALFAVLPAISPTTGTLTYTPAPNAFGSATVTVTLHDNGGTANGGVDTSAPQTFTVTVNSVNDAPSFTEGADQTVNEDAGPQAVNAWATAISAGPANESGQALTFEVSGNTNPGLFSAGPTVTVAGALAYTPAANAFGTATITLRLKDDGGTANGGVDVSPDQTFTITVTPVNDAPAFTKGADQTVNEDAGAQSVANWATGISAGPANESGQALTFDLTTNNDALFAVLPSVSPTTGTLTYAPAANANGVAAVTVRLKDNGGTANGGADTSSPQTFVITVNGVNDAPVFTKGANQAVTEDAGPQSVAGWATAISPGPANESAQAVSFEVTGNTNPDLFAGAPAVSPAGTLTYTPAADAFGTATITLRLKDDGGAANGGVDVSPTQSFTISVNSVNDAPTFTPGGDQTVNEDAGARTVTGWATAISAGPANESGQGLTFEVLANTNPGLFSAPPSVSPTTGTLTYTPAADAFGSATITLRLRDTGGTANGGTDVSPSQTFTITVNPVNDAPAFTKGPNETTLEDAGPQAFANWATGISAGPAGEAGQALTFEVVSNTNPALFTTLPAVSPAGALTYTPAPDANGSATVTLRLRDDGGTANGGADASPDQTFTITVTGVNDAPTFTRGADQSVPEDAGPQAVTGWATGVSAGPADEGTQALTFLVTTNNNALFAVLPAVDPATGTLTYTPAANASGSAAVTVRLRDTGGTLNGGTDTSPPQTFTIAVAPVNDAPTFTKGPNQTVREDAGPQGVNGWATGISPGAPNEAGQVLSFEVTGNTNPALFSAGPAVTAAGALTYTPAPDASGSATITIRLTDDGGTASGGADASAPQTFTITVTGVNDAPTFVAGGDQSAGEDAGPQVVTGWATAISPGPADEAGQAVAFQVVGNTNPGLFAALPAVAPDGTLTYTPAADAFGTAAITVRLKDTGGTANGGQDTSPPQTFVITVRPVNDAPSFTKGPDVTVAEDAGPQTRAEWATNLSKGPPNESSQALSFEVTGNTNPGLFAAAPAVSPAGTLTFTPAADANGSATITLRVKDNGGTADGGVDASTPQTFTITVTGANDRPVAVADAVSTTDEVPVTVDVLANDTDADGDPLTLVSVAGATRGTATIINNQVRYTPRTNAHGDDVLTYTVRDPSGATATGTLTVHVTDVTAPTVKEVRLYYGTGRYEVLTDRIPVLGWSNVRRIQLVFSENVSVQQGDLRLTGVNVANYAFSAFAYNATTFTATWTLTAPIGIDRLRLALDGTTANGVKDATAGNLIGQDVVRQFAVLPGDLDGDGVVTLTEANTVKTNIGKRYPNPKTADVNGDGLVTLADYQIVKANVGKRI